MRRPLSNSENLVQSPGQSTGAFADVRLRARISYDGTDFSGWAKQPGKRSVEGNLEDALSQVLRLEKSPRWVCAGRTDAGVHATGQVAHFDVPITALKRMAHSRDEKAALAEVKAMHGAESTIIPAAVTDALSRRLNGFLGRDADLVINGIDTAPEGFDARFSAMARRYEYRIADGLEHTDPRLRRITTFHMFPLDIDAMNEVADMMLGLRDFGSFCKPRPGATTIRELQEFHWTRDETGVIVARLQADAFCHSMVRALVGACVAGGKGYASMSEIKDLRDANQRTATFKVMPPHGLTLTEVIYPPKSELAARAEATRGRRELTEAE